MGICGKQNGQIDPFWEKKETKTIATRASHVVTHRTTGLA